MTAALTFPDPTNERRILIVDFDTERDRVLFMTAAPESPGDEAALLARCGVYLPIEHIAALRDALDRYLDDSSPFSDG